MKVVNVRDGGYNHWRTKVKRDKCRDGGHNRQEKTFVVHTTWSPNLNPRSVWPCAEFMVCIIIKLTSFLVFLMIVYLCHPYIYPFSFFICMYTVPSIADIKQVSKCHDLHQSMHTCTCASDSVQMLSILITSLL